MNVIHGVIVMLSQSMFTCSHLTSQCHSQDVTVNNYLLSRGS